MNGSILATATAALESIEREGLTKHERAILSPQGPHIVVEGTKPGHEVINLCANNYLGLADHPRLLEAAREALASHGLGMASVRFICGTSDLHLALERRVATFLGTEDAILFSSCFDANGGVFETLLGSEDAVVSDALNHASIIDGIRLCKARRLRYANNDMTDLEAQLKQATDARVRLVATDGVFSMDGIIANLPTLCELAQRYDAAVLVDDSHAVGVMGRRGAGTHEHHGVEDKVDLLTGTFGKALGGAAGGYVAGRRALIELLRQRARPYLFSNALPPPICAATLAALDLLESEPSLIERVHDNAGYFRAAMAERGFRLVGGGHPIVPVMIGDARLATQMASRLGSLGIFVTAFSFPVVPRGEARIRTQMSAAHGREDLDRAIEAFTTVGRELGVPA
jgi:glycine C-acetyltransferase